MIVLGIYRPQAGVPFLPFLMVGQVISNKARKIRGGATLPATCSPDDVFVKTGGGSEGEYVCLSTNVWSGPFSIGTVPVKATGAEIDTGTNDTKFVTPKGLNDSHNVPSVAPGTDGNVLTSNGTDWVSETPASATVTAASIQDFADTLLSTTTVDTNVGTKQPLYTCPALKHCVITKVILRNASASLATMGDAMFFGFNAGVSDFGSIGAQPLTGITDATVALGFSQISNGSNVVWKIGTAADVFGCAFNDTSITATVVIDVFGYVY
jgi:hypothetical protein